MQNDDYKVIMTFWHNVTHVLKYDQSCLRHWIWIFADVPCIVKGEFNVRLAMQLSNWSLLTRDTGHQVRKEDLNSASEMEVERAAVVGIMIDMCQIAVPSLHVTFWPLMFSVCVLQCCGARSYQFTLIGLTLSCPWGNAISGRFYCFKPDHLLEDIFMFAYVCWTVLRFKHCLFGAAVTFNALVYLVLQYFFCYLSFTV